MPPRLARSCLAVVAAVVAGCGDGETVEGSLPDAPDLMVLESPDFGEGDEIPRGFTCDGAGSSPPLRWSGVPHRAVELAVVMEDPDAPGATFVHWILTRIPPRSTRLAAGRRPSRAVEAENSFGDHGYGGPCPPEDDEPHRYVFALYALSKRLNVDRRDSPKAVRTAIGKAAMARGRLSATYGR